VQHDETRSSVRERLLAAADELFYAEGITAVGVEKIRAKADVAKSSLYGHFASKDQLVAAYLRRRSLGWRAQLEHALTVAGPDADSRLATIFAELGRWFAAPGFRGCPFINAAAELTAAGHPWSAVATDHRQWVLEVMLRIAKDSGAAEPEPAARQLLMIYNASMVEAHAGSTTAAADAHAVARRILAAK
jgi:AcrR family transcriptional regulator